MYACGDILLTTIQFPDTYEIKNRPVVVLFEEEGNIIVAGITSKPRSKGIYLYKKDGVPKDCVVRTNYVFTITPNMVKKKLLSLPKDKVALIVAEFTKKLK